MYDYDVFALTKNGEVFCIKDHIYTTSAFEAKKQATVNNITILDYRCFIGCKSNYKAEINSKLSPAEIVKFHNLCSSNQIYLMENLESAIGDSFRAIYPKLGEHFDLEDKYFFYRRYNKKYYSCPDFPSTRINYAGIAVELYKAGDKNFKEMFE